MSKYFFESGFNRTNGKRFSKKSKNSANGPQIFPDQHNDRGSDFRDRSHSAGAYVEDFRKEKVDRNLDDFENRRRYVSTVLERYYSHPSNRYHSMPSSTRQQFVDALVANGQGGRRAANSCYIDDSGSEISTPMITSQSARVTPEPSFYDDNEYRYNNRKPKSGFFRSSSIRSLKKLMSKLSGNNSGSRYRRSATDPGYFGGPPTRDSGLETPSESSVNYNSNYIQTRSRSPAEMIGCSVSPKYNRNNFPNSNNQDNSGPPTPALCGIQNHGNTCYINAIMQCLSNTDLLAEYFLSGRYLTDLNNNLRNADRYGSQGNVTVALAEFFRALWFNMYSPDVSMAFKRVVERYSEQYRGNEQQDAQEFFYWLSDRVHEDLNVAVKRRYKLHKSRSKNEDELATAAMEKHLEAHNSFVSARFHGLFLSSVTCPVCYKQSTKPDPFMCVSLPVSQSTKRPLFVVIVFLNRQPRQVRFGLNADVTATFQEVKKCLADATGLDADNMLLCEMNDRGFQSTLPDQNEVISLGRTKCVWAIETPSTYNPCRDDELILLVGNQNGNGKRFGPPVALNVHREVSYGDLCRSILLALRPQLRSNTFVQEFPLSAFRIRVIDNYRQMAYIPQDVALPLYTETVDSALTVTHSTSTTFHLKVMLEWQKEAKERYFLNNEHHVVDHTSAQDLREQELRPEIQGLRDCLAEYTKPESCQWYCPNCHRRRDDAVKRIVLYWLPDILVIHLKRFKRQSSGQLVKLDSPVWFPIADLDLTEFMHESMINRNHPTSGTPSTTGYRALNGELYLDSTQINQNVYDLYAVCNHSGHSPNSGHYTAYCRNPVNGKWYCFDDQTVMAIRDCDVVTNSAYLLFYERRQARANGNGQHSSTESGFVDHWYFRLYSQANRRNSSSSKDTLDGIDSNGSSSDGQGVSPQNEPKSTFATAEKSVAAPATPQTLQQGKLFVKLPDVDQSKKNDVAPPRRSDLDASGMSISRIDRADKSIDHGSASKSEVSRVENRMATEGKQQNNKAILPHIIKMDASPRIRKESIDNKNFDQNGDQVLYRQSTQQNASSDSKSMGGKTQPTAEDASHKSQIDQKLEPPSTKSDYQSESGKADQFADRALTKQRINYQYDEQQNQRRISNPNSQSQKSIIDHIRDNIRSKVDHIAIPNGPSLKKNRTINRYLASDGHISNQNSASDQSAVDRHSTNRVSSHKHVISNCATSDREVKVGRLIDITDCNKEIDDVFADIGSIALPSCSKILTTGFAAPIASGSNRSPASNSAINNFKHVRTRSIVETDL